MGCTSSKTIASGSARTQWTAIRTRLPRSKTPDELKRRDALYKLFDPNGNGYLSFAEVERGAKAVLGLDTIIRDERQLQSVLVRAFNCAKAARMASRGLGMGAGGGAGVGAAIASAADEDQNHVIERVEFRLLLVYIYDYFEMWVAFDEIDSSNDKSVSLEEFTAAVPRIRAWGVTVRDPEATFRSIDASGGGIVSFQEFAEWAIQQHLRVDSEGDAR